MRELLTRLSSGEFWLTVILGPILAGLAVEGLKRLSADDWARWICYATGLALIGLAVMEYRFATRVSDPELASIGAWVPGGCAIAFFGRYGTTKMRAVLAAFVNVPAVLVLILLSGKDFSSMAATDLARAFGFLYASWATVVLAPMMVWLLFAPPWERRG